MKKSILILLILSCGFFAAAQKTTGGNYTYIAQRYEWLTGIFQALNLPAGDSAQHKSGQDTRSGAVYLDTVNTQTSPAGFYIYKSGVWELQDDNNICQNRLIDPITITYTGVGMKFFVSGGRYQIGCNFYSLDSATLTLDNGGTNPRKDVFYLDATGAHVLEGTEGVSPLKPQVDGDQLELTFVDVAAAATTPAPGISYVVIYDENTEWTITNTGTTTDPDNATNVYKGSKSLNVTNINNGDIVHATGGATINVLQYDAISGFIKLKAPMAGAAKLLIRFRTGATIASNEVTININKSSTNWQGFSIPISLFNFSNSSVDRVDIRYVYATAAEHAGFYLDFFHFEDGLSQPSSGATITMGALDGAVKSPNGGVIANNKLHLQTADANYPGLMSSVLYSKLTGLRYNYFIKNLTNIYDTLATAVNDSIVGIKALKDSTGIGIIDRGDYLSIYNTAGDANLLFDSLGSAGISPVTTRNDTLYSRRIDISGGDIDTTASGGLLITIPAGSTPTLQQVLDVGSTLTSSETISLGSNSLNFNGSSTIKFQPVVYHNPSYISDYIVALSNINNGVSAKGAIDFREWSTGGGDIVTLTPVDDITSSYEIYLPPGNNGDTLATQAYARSVGGGGMTNPMTTSQDLIVGGASGTPTRVGVGTNGQRLGVSAGNITWVDNDATWNGLLLQTLQTSSTSVTLSTHGLYTYVGTADATFTLPALSSNLNRIYFIKNSSAFNLTVQRAGSDNLFTTSSVTSITIPAGSSRILGATTASGTSYWHVMDLSEGSGGGGTGDVVGPASATDGVPALFDGTTGKLIKNSTPTGTGNPVMQTSPTINTKLTVTGATETGSSNPVASVTQTWDNAATTFIGADYDYTSTASAVGSLLSRWRLGGTTQFEIRKDGSTLAATGHYVGTSHAQTGLELGTSNRIYLRSAGTQIMTLTTGGVSVGSGTGIGWTSTSSPAANSQDVSLFRDGGNGLLAQRGGTLAQEFRIYNTDNGANDEFLSIGSQNAANTYQIASEATGTGTARNISIMGGNVSVNSSSTFTDRFNVNGNINLLTAGNKLLIATGSNASVGTATLVGGTVTVSTTAVTASSKIFLTVGVAGGTQGFLAVGTITAGTSFVINSTSGTETSDVNWWIIN